MYNKFFGFKEKPFKLVPNPEYLFLSKSHEEILAHLTYAINQGDGFVEITGEVGTGKTTLCRAFLESLDKSFDAAYIFNPKLDALQLLKVINDEFGIDSSPDNTKDLIDILNGFLIARKAAGQKVLVLIDEAQNLSLEVLEQLRLLSNLETTQKKLLQIILVGQPELGEVLSSHQLRQLGQRITINCRLTPLTFQETKDYIRHRISLASHRAGPPFDKGSCRAIFKFSKGVPRLINIACDRVLLNAFSRNSFKITASITKEALNELSWDKSGYSPRWFQTRWRLVVLTAVLASLAIIVLFLFNGPGHKTSVSDKLLAFSRSFLPQGQESVQKNTIVPPQPPDAIIAPEAHTTLPADAAPVLAQAPESSAVDMKETLPPAAAKEQSDQTDKALSQFHIINDEGTFFSYLKSLNRQGSRSSALKEALKLWFPADEVMVSQREIDSDPFFFQETTMFYDLQVLHLVTDADLNLVQNINLPAIFTFYLEDSPEPRFLAAVYADREKLYFLDADHDFMLMVDKNVVLKYWSGEAYVIWKNFLNLQGMITPQSEGSAVKTLKYILQQLGYRQLDTTDRYDKETFEIIKHIQKKNGIKTDGLVGPLTKIILYNESIAFEKPSLAAFEGTRRENAN